MTELYSKLATKVSLCVNRGFVPFIMGGSRDLTCAVVEAYLLAAKSDKPVTDVTFVQISHTLDVAPLLGENLPHQTSRTRYLVEKSKQEGAPRTKFVAFGLEGSRITQQDASYV